MSMKNQIKQKKDGVELMIELLLVQEGKHWVALAPALGLSSHARTQEEAKKAFGEALDIFLEETVERGTLEKLLLDLGWTLRKKPAVLFEPPGFDMAEVAHLLNSGITRSRSIRQKVSFSI